MATAVRALGEIALRVRDLDAMQRFYQEVLGLPLLRRFPHAAFFRVAGGHAGHTQIVALFDRNGEEGQVEPEPERSTVDHLAFAIDLNDFEREKARLEGLGCEVDTAEHGWVRWRSLYLNDPEGNRVELVCYDPSVGEGG